MKYLISLIAYLIPAISMAQDAATVGAAGGAAAPAAPGIESLVFQLVIIFVIFYFLLIRPQQKKFKAHTLMVNALKKGDKVITGAGFAGVVTKAVEGDRFVDVEIASGVEVKVLRSSITDFADKPAVVEKGKK